MILIYHNQASRDLWNSLSEADRSKGLRAHMEIIEELVASDEMVVSEALAEPEKGRRIVARPDGTLESTDGPFTEAKEHLAGFYLIDCSSIDRAISYARRIPEASLGLVEVRPVLSQGGADIEA